MPLAVRPAARLTRAGLAAAAILSLAAACSDTDLPVSPDLGIPINGSFRGVVLEDDTTLTLFTAGRSGQASVAICAPEGMEFALAVAGVKASTPGSCERVQIPVVAGRSYAIAVIAEDGAGPFNGCFSAWEFADCTVLVPYPYHPSLPIGYYDDAEGLTGTALIAALNDIIDDQRLFSYEDARDSMYASVDDPDDDDVIIGLYTGRDAPNVFSRGSALTAGLNAEHTWPQSLGAGELPARSDLHVIYPVFEEANSQRLAHPYGEVTGAVFWQSTNPADPSEVSRLGQDSQGRTVFEPRDSKKGDVARAIFYFHVRYRGDPTTSFSLANFNIEESTLLDWALEDPPDDYEQERNALAFRVQGNRNPFVDRVDFLTRIGDFPNN